MLFVVVAFAVFMIAVGAVGLVTPAKRMDYARWWQLPGRLWVAGANTRSPTRRPLAFDPR